MGRLLKEVLMFPHSESLLANLLGQTADLYTRACCPTYTYMVCMCIYTLTHTFYVLGHMAFIVQTLL